MAEKTLDGPLSARRTGRPGKPKPILSHLTSYVSVSGDLFFLVVRKVQLRGAAVCAISMELVASLAKTGPVRGKADELYVRIGTARQALEIIAVLSVEDAALFALATLALRGGG